MTDPTIHRDLGRIDATLDAQGKQIAALIKSQEAMATHVNEIHDVMTAAKGSWRTLVVVGSISSALTTAVIKFLGMFKAWQ